MVDPDIPAMSCNNWAYFKHWIVTNISGVELKSGSANLEQIPNVNVLLPYIPPGARNGIHRYQFFIFQEFNCPVFGPRVIDAFDDKSEMVNFGGTDFEVKWSVTGFAEYNKLRALAGFEWRVDTGIPDECPPN